MLVVLVRLEKLKKRTETVKNVRTKKKLVYAAVHEFKNKKNKN